MGFISGFFKFFIDEVIEVKMNIISEMHTETGFTYGPLRN